MCWNYGTFGFINTDLIAEHSLCIKDLGLEKRQNVVYDYENAKRDYQGYLFQYTLDGYGILESEGINHRLSKGKAFFISFPDNSRYYLPPSDEEDHNWSYFYIHFSGPAIEPFFQRLRELSGPIISLEIDNNAIQLFFELYETIRNGKQLERYKGSEWLYRFLIALLRGVEFPPNKKNSPYVMAAMNWMQAHYAKPQNLEEMSREIGISFSHLSRQFYKEQGITPIQHLTRLRVEHAVHLLLNTNMTIQKIAEDCGFSCGNYFAKVYKKALHVNPKEYRKQHNIN